MISPSSKSYSSDIFYGIVYESGRKSRIRRIGEIGELEQIRQYYHAALTTPGMSYDKSSV